MTARAQEIVKAMRGLKEDELRALGPCAICKKPMLGQEGSGITFYVVELRRAGWERQSLQRRIGLEVMLGGSDALARAFSPNEDLAKVFDGPHRVAIHENCAGEVHHLLDLLPEAATT